MDDPADLQSDLWESRALPILRYIAAQETDMGFITVGELSSALAIDGHAVTIELEGPAAPHQPLVRGHDQILRLPFGRTAPQPEYGGSFQTFEPLRVYAV